MGVGAAVASVAGGVMKMGAASKYASAGKDAARMSEEQMRKAEGALDQSRVDWERQLDFSQQFSDMMNEIANEYGEYASNYMQEWENTFGSMRDNLVQYYNELDPTKFSTQAKAEIGKQIDTSMKQFDETAAQSGIYTSGMKLQNQKESQFNKAQAFAQADLAAPEHVAQMQQGFYGAFGEPMRNQAVGLQGQSILNKGQMAQMGFTPQYNAMGNIAGLGSQYANLYSNQANQYNQSAAGYGQAAGQSAGQGMNMVFSGLGSLFG